ncbi:MAG: hypothetical protein JWR10_1990 [Rubritepida sp.]|nr:hypothetical protein [Rubritepida sp.]
MISAAGLLAGCGFRPVYGPDGERNPEALVGASEPGLIEQLASVRVGQLGERSGQLMRRSLQRQLEDLRPGTQARYDLAVTLAYAAEVLGYRRDGTITRVRYTATSTWILATAAVPPVIIDRGTARTLDAFNIPDLQFFAADASREDMERRLVAELSSRVALGVAAALRRRMQA